MTTDFGRFILFQNDLKFQEMTETFDAIEVHTSSADEIQRAMFDNSPDLAIGEAQRLAQAFRILALACGCRTTPWVLPRLLADRR